LSRAGYRAAAEISRYIQGEGIKRLSCRSFLSISFFSQLPLSLFRHHRPAALYPLFKTTMGSGADLPPYTAASRAGFLKKLAETVLPGQPYPYLYEVETKIISALTHRNMLVWIRQVGPYCLINDVTLAQREQKIK
jgi:hypothetical protein